MAMVPVSVAQDMKAVSRTAWNAPTKILARSVQTITSRSIVKAHVSAEEEALPSLIQPQTRTSAFVQMGSTQLPKDA
jgi:hypothetical protein